MGEHLERFPLFPLGLVLLPGETVPLHIFEQRYRTMIDTCLESDLPFGMLWMGDAGLKQIGCTARIAQVLERMDDGRANIIVEGAQPFRLERRVEDLAYPAGDIELLEDDPGSEGDESDARVHAHAEYAGLVEKVTDSRPEEADLAGLDAYAMASTIAFELESKQELLEIRSESDRLERLAELCARAVERFDYAQTVSERAQTNGKVRH